MCSFSHSVEDTHTHSRVCVEQTAEGFTRSLELRTQKMDLLRTCLRWVCVLVIGLLGLVEENLGECQPSEHLLTAVLCV